ncbi:hypothetical protein VA7868_03739 [Vibrio aerogenes CECT 7868]|uniref:Uncharacterized protein n=1 Tax=Vibrio aerogenes CECT 7868 TaxID=1216006 RepID=A0A1M6B999_9VIBR|nr:hypothetical protein [Vibrio aerogenes]SHI45043.1 hypothetical protein VA7868_03739 [Vibrio aerogenes CECT 7868]
MAILTKSGRTAIAQSIAAQPVFMAWGRGESAWEETPPSEPVTSTALVDTVGFRKSSRVLFCEPDPDGEIVVTSGRFKLSDTPTNHLFCEFRFDFEDAQGETLREVGVMVGTTPKADTPAGQFYFKPEELDKDGTLLLLEYRKPLYRDIGVRETFEFVITF